MTGFTVLNWVEVDDDLPYVDRYCSAPVLLKVRLWSGETAYAVGFFAMGEFFVESDAFEGSFYDWNGDVVAWSYLK